MKCILNSVDNRFFDAVHYRKRMIETYFNPDSFRRNMNSLFQELRNITFLLQKQKSKISGFEEWYAVWQERLKSDPICKWSVEARNLITKSGDLKTLSRARLVIYNDWLSESIIEIAISPTIPTRLLVTTIANRIPRDQVTEESVLCVERKWIDKEFSDYELSVATGHCLKVLADLLIDAHRQFDSDPECTQIDKIRKFADETAYREYELDDSRRTFVKLSNLHEATRSIATKRYNRADFQEIENLYGFPENSADEKLANPMEKFSMWLFDTGKIMIEKDGFLISSLHAMTEDNKYFQMVFRFEDRADKHIQIRGAAEMLKHFDVKFAAISGEVWVSTVEDIPQGKPVHAYYAKTREEGISISMVSSIGDSFNVEAIYKRSGGKVHVQKPTTSKDFQNMTAPILHAIRRRSNKPL